MKIMDEAAHRARWWAVAKWAVALVILGFVGREFYVRLSEVQATEIDWRPSWFILAGGLYLAGVGASLWYWWSTLRTLGQDPGIVASVRAYYVGHLGKYVPGKAMVIIMRTAMIRGPRVQTSAAALTTVYETLTQMAVGAFLAVLVFLAAVVLNADFFNREGRLLLSALLLIPACAVVAPWIFNPAVARIVAPFRGAGAAPLPRFQVRMFLAGVVPSLISWVFFGASLWATVAAVRPYPFGGMALVKLTAYLCVATVGGFFTPLPGGLGAREYILWEMLKEDGEPAWAALVPPLFRLSCIVAELAAAAILFPLPYVGLQPRTHEEAIASPPALSPVAGDESGHGEGDSP